MRSFSVHILAYLVLLIALVGLVFDPAEVAGGFGAGFGGVTAGFA